MNKKYILVLLLVVVAGIVAQIAFAASNSANTNPNANTKPTASTATSQKANIIPFANIGPSASQGASASTTAPTVTEQAKTKLIQFVDKPYNVTYDSSGSAIVKISPSGLLSVDGYRQVCTQIFSTNGNTQFFNMDMGYAGKISALGYRLAINVPVDTGFSRTPAHCYSVDGPLIDLTLVGNPNTNDQVQLWLYLRS